MRNVPLCTFLHDYLGGKRSGSELHLSAAAAQNGGLKYLGKIQRAGLGSFKRAPTRYAQGGLNCRARRGGVTCNWCSVLAINLTINPLFLFNSQNYVNYEVRPFKIKDHYCAASQSFSATGCIELS